MGLVVSVCFCFLSVVFRTQFENVGMEEIEICEEKTILRWNGALHYLNKDLFREKFMFYLKSKHSLILENGVDTEMQGLEGPKIMIIDLNLPFVDYDGTKCLVELILEAEKRN